MGILENRETYIKHISYNNIMGGFMEICHIIYQLKPQNEFHIKKYQSTQESWDAMHQVWDVSGWQTCQCPVS